VEVEVEVEVEVGGGFAQKIINTRGACRNFQQQIVEITIV
jgi:hypothetical protein